MQRSQKKTEFLDSLKQLKQFTRDALSSANGQPNDLGNRLLESANTLEKLARERLPLTLKQEREVIQALHPIIMLWITTRIPHLSIFLSKAASFFKVNL